MSPNSTAGGNLRIGAGGEEAGAGEQEPEGGGIAGKGGSTAQRCCSSILTISLLTWCCAARTRALTFRGEASSWMIGRPAGRCSPILLRTRCSHLRRAASARLATVRGLPALGLAPRFTGSIATVVTTHHSAECDKAECDNAECDKAECDKSREREGLPPSKRDEPDHQRLGKSMRRCGATPALTCSHEGGKGSS